MVTLLLFQRFGRAFYGTIDPCNALANLFLPLAADNSQHGLGVRRLLQSLAKLRFVQQFGNVGQRVQMLLELPPAEPGRA